MWEYILKHSLFMLFMVYDVAVLGGGMAGLSAAYELQKAGKKVALLEKEKDVGGLTRSFTYKGHTLDYGSHVLFGHRKEALGLVKELGREDALYSKPLGHLCMQGGKSYQYSSMGGLLRLVLRFKRTPYFVVKTLMTSKKGISKYSIEEWCLRHLGKEAYEGFFGPMLEKRLRQEPAGTSAATLQEIIRRYVTYSTKGDEIYLEGGMGALPGMMENALDSVDMIKGIRIRSLSGKGSFDISTSGGKVKASAIVSALPPPELERIAGIEAPELEYLHSLFVYYGVDGNPLEGNFDMIVPDESFWFQRIFDNSAVLRQPGKQRVLCADSYYTQKPEVGKEEDACTSSMERLFPGFGGMMRWSKSVFYPYTSAVCAVREQESREGIFLAGQHYIYSRGYFPSIDDVIVSGREAAKESLRYLG